jgi:hypothetical protein
MSRRKFRISGGDDASYGPSFGPVIVEEVGEVAQGWGGPFLLVRLLESVSFRGEPVEHMTLSPRYVDDTLDSIRNGNCVIAFGRVRPGMLEDAKKEIRYENTQTIAVGESRPVA